jgi:hypothetical protein
MSEKGIDFITPAGRLVWGHPAKSQIKKHQDGAMKGQPVIRDGKQVEVWSFGVAFNKAEFQRDIWPIMSQEAATGYPAGIPPRFAWKYQDGDGIDSKGQPFNQREGYAGCYVLTFSSELMATPIFKLENGAYRQLDPKEIKTGDYVSVGGNVKVNVAVGTNTPSLYVNPRAVELVGYGTEIVGQGAADPNALFGGRVHQLPPGASAVPVMSPGGVGMPGTAPMQPAMTAPGGMPGAPVAPMQPAFTPPAPVAPMAPPPPPAGPQRPTDPNHIHQPGTPGEMWWINGAWAPALVAPLPPPAHDFVQGATGMPGAPMQPAMPGMMPPR